MLPGNDACLEEKTMSRSKTVWTRHVRLPVTGCVVFRVVRLLMAVVVACTGPLMPGCRPHIEDQHLRADCRNRLRAIEVAMRAYHQDHGRFPPAYTTDAAGQPMHSWRVLLLPYLEHMEEYRQYRFDEPWNSPHNRRIVDAVAVRNTFRCPGAKGANAESPEDTNYMMIVGVGMVSDGSHSVRLEDVRDDPRTTILVAEVYGTGVAWAEPRDINAKDASLRINDASPNAIRSRHRGGAHVLFCDGRIGFLRETLDPKTVEAMATIAGGEAISRDALGDLDK